MSGCQLAETRGYSLSHCQNLDSQVTNATSTKAVSTPEFNLATTHHSSWKPEALPPATHQQNQCPPPSLFPHMARFWIELYHVSIWLESIGPGPWPQLQRELGKRIFLISTLGKTCKVFKGDWLPEDLTGVVSHALMLVVGVYFNTSVFDIISPQEKSTHPSLSKWAFIKTWILVKIRISWNPTDVSIAYPHWNWRFAGSHSSTFPSGPDWSFLCFSLNVCSILFSIYSSLCSALNFHLPKILFLWGFGLSSLQLLIYIYGSKAFTPLLP